MSDGKSNWLEGKIPRGKGAKTLAADEGFLWYVIQDGFS